MEVHRSDAKVKSVVKNKKCCFPLLKYHIIHKPSHPGHLYTRLHGTIAGRGIWHLLGLDHRDNLSTKNSVPEAASHPEAVLVVEEVVLKVIFFEVLVPQGKVLVVEEVVRQVVAHIAEDAAAVNGGADVPVQPEDGMGQFPEGCSEDDEQCWRHHQAILVHGQVVMDAVEGEMQRDTDSVVRKVTRVGRNVVSLDGM